MVSRTTASCTSRFARFFFNKMTHLGSGRMSSATLSRNRRPARDFERCATAVAAFLRHAIIRPMLKRLTKAKPCSSIHSTWIGS